MTKLRRSFYYSILIHHVALILAAMVHAQDDQSGFISIDCGIPEGSKYTDKRTGINYVSDAGFIDAGVSRNILPEYNRDTLDLQLTTLTSFPHNIRNCYTLTPKQGKNNTYLIRLRFSYGNYDSEVKPPQFDLYLGADLWNKVNIPNSSGEYYHEMIHTAASDYINICLVNIDKGTPFVSVIELRLLGFTINQLQSLDTLSRIYFGSNGQIRYEDDKYDRIWYPVTRQAYRVIQTSETISSSGPLKVPSKVMSTASTPTMISTDSSISYTWNVSSINRRFIFYMHFAEVETLKPNQTREMNVYLNSKKLNGSPIIPSSTDTTTIISPPVTSFSSYTLEITKTPNSTLPPIINAIEVYILKQFQRHQTLDQDAAAIWSTKSSYGLKRNNWQGDPCVPQEYVWDGLNCNYNDPQAARIISLNLSSSGLSGEMATALANLTMIQSLDLSYNNLTGGVPEFLAQLDNLMTLDLRGNNFTRPIPAELLSKSKKGLSLRIDQEISDQVESSCPNGSCKKKNNKVVISVVISVTAFVVVLFAIVWITLKRRKTKGLVTILGGPPPTGPKTNMKEVIYADLIRREEPFPSRHKQFTYSQVEDITNNLTDVIGRGGFGNVYRGLIGDNQVAVKMLSESSNQGDKEFHAEVKLLMDVRHKNITSFIGYCNDRGKKGIIYEFMANGNLEKHIFYRSPNVLSWESRLQIACDAAEGLEYMHHGCSPPIVHRDIKSSNILLNESFQAKLGDLGLSKAFTTEYATHVTTLVAGTPGYLDPEYFTNGWLTEKSDVYSFGVVLLELITSRRALSEDINIIDWVKSMVEEGSVEKTIDPRLEGVFNINTAWKVVELALACVSPTSNNRPNMNDVVRDLKQCLQEVKTRHGIKSNNQNKEASLNMESVSDPSPR